MEPRDTLINKPPRDVAVGINASISQKWPVRALCIDGVEIGFDDEHLLAIHTGLGDRVSALNGFPRRLLPMAR